MLVVKNKDLFKTNSDVHSFSTRSYYDLHIPAENLAVFQNGVWYSGIKIYNHIPPTIKQLSYDISKFKVVLKRFLYTNSFYTLEEYYSWKPEILFSYHYILAIQYTITLLLKYCITQNTYAYTYKAHM